MEARQGEQITFLVYVCSPTKWVDAAISVYYDLYSWTTWREHPNNHFWCLIVILSLIDKIIWWCQAEASISKQRGSHTIVAKSITITAGYCSLDHERLTGPPNIFLNVWCYTFVRHQKVELCFALAWLARWTFAMKKKKWCEEKQTLPLPKKRGEGLYDHDKWWYSYSLNMLNKWHPIIHLYIGVTEKRELRDEKW